MSIYDFEVMTANGEKQTLAPYEGKLLLIVNTASKCGFTPQYKGLQELYDSYKENGLVVLGFPCNQFANQEPGSIGEIEAFCKLNYNVTFPLFDKVKVKGRDMHPLFRHLTNEAPGVLGSKTIKWNFTKFLVDGDGKVLKRYGPNTAPDKIEEDLKQVLG